MGAISVCQPRRRKRPGLARALTKAERRLYDAIPEEIDYVAHADYRLVATEARLFGPEARDIEVHRWRSYFDGEEPARGAAAGCVRLSRADEAELFRRYNYARYRLARAIRPQRRHFSTVRARQALIWHRRAVDGRAALIGANMSLVLAMARGVHASRIEFGELVSEGNMALMRAVDKFDVSRGFKFSTYACQAILKAFNRLMTRTRKFHQRFATAYRPELEKSDEVERRHRHQRDLAIEDLQRVLGGNLANLSKVEHTVVEARFALNGYGKPHTLEMVSSLVGVSRERVRQIQACALTKLRAAMEQQVA